MIAAIVIFLLLAAAAAFYFVVKNNKDSKAEQLTVQKAVDTPAVKKDTIPQKIIVPATTGILNPATDSMAFNVVIREYRTQAKSDNVAKTYRSYGHKVLQYSKRFVDLQTGISF